MPQPPRPSPSPFRPILNTDIKGTCRSKLCLAQRHVSNEGTSRFKPKKTGGSADRQQEGSADRQINPFPILNWQTNIAIQIDF